MTPVLVIVCAWCPDFNPTAQIDKGISHGMCPTCCAREMAKLDALEAAR